jgi:HK97 family phage major capsid protein
MLTNAQKKRLAELLRKPSIELTADDRKELDSLSALATSAGITLDAEFCKAADALTAEGDTALSDEQVKSLVEGALSEALKAKGIDLDSIRNAVKEANQGHLTTVALNAAITEAIGKSNNSNEIITAVKGALLESQKNGITADTLADAMAKALEKHFSAQRTGSKNLFPSGPEEGDSNVIEHRAGNLTVAQKELLNVCLGKGRFDGIDSSLLTRAQRAGTKALDNFARQGYKAITTGGAGSGAELIPSDLSADLQMRLYLESQLAAIMVSQEINMPTDPFKLPLKTTRTPFYVGSEAPGSDPVSSQPGTGTITLDAKKLIGVADYSYEADEDSIVPILPMLQDDLALGAAQSLEGALINGDDTATHQDSDIHAIANHHAKLFRGLRKYAFAGTLSNDLTTGGVGSAANIKAMGKAMGKWGVRPSDLVLICGPRGYSDLVGLPETLTAEKVGNPAAARILTGVAPTIFGIPIVVSEECREDLNASGVFDNTLKTNGSILLVHRPSFYVGVRRGFTVETDEDRKKQTRSVIASFRRDFKPRETPSATMPIVRVGFKYVA